MFGGSRLETCFADFRRAGAALNLRQRRSGLASARLKVSLGRRRSLEIFGVSRLEICCDDFRGADPARNLARLRQRRRGFASVRLE